LPKIPIYVAGEQIPLIEQPRISGSTLAAPYESLQHGAHGIEHGAGFALGHTLAIEAEQRRQSQLSESVKHLNGATTDLLDAENELRTGKRDASGEVVEPPAGASDFLQRWRDKHKEIGQNYLDKITDPRIKDMFMRGWDRASASAYREAVNYQRSLFVKEDTANVEQGLSDFLRLAQQATTPEDAQRNIDMGNALLDGKHMILGAMETFRQRKNFNDEWNMYQNKQQIDLSGNYDRAAAAKLLGPSHITTLDAYRETSMRHQNVEFDKRQHANDREAEAERQRLLVEIDQKVTNGVYTLKDLDNDVEQRVVAHGAEYEHIRTRITNPRDEASDPATWRDVSADVWSPTPSYTPARIRALMDQGRLNIADGRMAMGMLTSKIEAKDKEDYTRAVGEGEKALGIITPFSQLDKREGKLVTDFLREFNSQVRSPSNPAGVAPRELLYRVLPAFLDRASAEARLSYNDQISIIRDLSGMQAPSMDVSDTEFYKWLREQRVAIEPLKTTSPSLYALRGEQLLRLATTRSNALEAAVRKQATPAKPGGGFLQKELR